MKSQSIVSPEDQTVTFVELFFDLVFVFSVTQVVNLLRLGLDWTVVGQAVLVFWLVWWAWTQYSWALNPADTTHPLIQLSVLVATAVAFFLAVALPGAFQDKSLLFAVVYVVMRVIGLTLNAWVASEDSSQRAAVRSFTLVSVGGLVAVLIGGLLGGTAQYWLWGLAIILDIAAAAIGGQREGWNLRPEHFAERHGLFVIIALGETLIVAAGTVMGAVWTGELLVLAVLAVAVTCGLWWTYFPRAKPVLDQALESARGSERAELARDAFSLLHFPMICGVIACASVVAIAVAHPGQPLSLAARMALAIGLALFVGGMAAAVWRATRRLLVPRLILTGVTAIAIVVVGGVSPILTFALALAGITLIAALEQPRKAWQAHPHEG